MYNFLKKTAFFFLPKKWINNQEETLRKITYKLAYKGDKYQCNLCDSRLSKFVVHPIHPLDLICPNCGSLPRTRALWNYLSSKIINPKSKYRILHFSPPKQLLKKLKNLQNTIVIDTDYESNNCLKNYDITNIEEKESSFDLIICYHILEHIPNDAKAIKELKRILKPTGKLFIQVPYSQNETIEETEPTSPENRLKLYGQNDHVRLYGYNNLINRLEKGGFKVNPLLSKSFSDKPDFYGFNPNDIIFECTK